MSDRLLESLTRAPSIVDRRNAQLQLCKDPLPTPWAGRCACQVLPVLAIDADRQGRKGKDWSDRSGQRPRGGVPAQVDLTAPTLGACEVADSIAPTVIERGATRLAPLVCSLPRNANIVARPAQRWPSDKEASERGCRPLARARVFPSDQLARLILDPCGPRVLIAPKGAQHSPTANQRPPMQRHWPAEHVRGRRERRTDLSTQSLTARG